jgi:hypothetical protein
MQKHGFTYRTKARGIAFFWVKIVPKQWFLKPVKLVADFRSSLKLLTPSAKARWAKHCLKEVDGLCLKILQALGKRRCCLEFKPTLQIKPTSHISVLSFKETYSFSSIYCKKRLATFPPRESLVSDIPAGDGNVANLFLQCSCTLYNYILNYELIIFS